MILEFIDIAGFRGISQLRLPLEEDNLLIGENAWGKSSLLDALTRSSRRALSPMRLTHRIFTSRPPALLASRSVCGWR